MKRFAFWLLAVCMMLLTVQGALAATVTPPITEAGTISDSSQYRGQGWVANYNMSIEGVYSFGTTSGMTRCQLYTNASGSCVLGATGSYSGTYCEFTTPYDVSAGDFFALTSDNSGGSWTWAYGNNLAVPYVMDAANLQGASSNTCSPNDGQNTRSIGGFEYVNTSNINSFSVRLFNNVTGASLGETYFSNVTGTLTFDYFNITTSGFCVIYTGNGTGTNCTVSGSGANTFFNVSITQNITGSAIVTASTYQSLVNLSAYRLFLNTSINNFNATNNKSTNQTTTGSLLLPLNAGSNNVIVSVPGNYTKNVTITGVALTTVQANATDIYDNQFTIGANYQGTGISTFTIQTINQTLTLNNITNTTIGSVVLQLLQGYNYYFQITGDTHATQNITLPANSSTNTYNFSVYLTNTINMTFYDEITESIINETVTLQVISDSFAQNYTINSTQTSGFNVSLLSPNQYTLRYSAPSYTQRDYYINLTNGTYNNIDLYLLDTTTANDVIATVETTGSIRVEGAIIKLLRYYVTCNCFKIVQMSTTSGEGQSLFWVQPLQGYYKWSVDYQGSNKFLSATSQQIVSDTVFFSISLQDDFYQSFAALTGMTNILTYNTTSGVMEYSYSDPSGLTTQGCLNVRYVNGTNWDERESCVSGSSGSVILILNNNTQYRYNAYIDTSTIYTQRVVLSGWTDQLSNFNFGLNGVFLSTSVLIGLSVIFSFSAIAVVITNGLGLILIYWLGFTTFQTGFIITFSAMAIGMGVFLLRK